VLSPRSQAEQLEKHAHDADAQEKSDGNVAFDMRARMALGAWDRHQDASKISAALILAKDFLSKSDVIDEWYHNAFKDEDWYKEQTGQQKTATPTPVTPVAAVAPVAAAPPPKSLAGADGIVLKGPLRKSGSFLGGLAWHDRWVTLDAERLCLFEDKYARIPKSTVLLSRILEVKPQDRDGRFTIRTTIENGKLGLTGRKTELTISLEAQPEERKRWVQTLKELISRQRRK